MPEYNDNSTDVHESYRGLGFRHVRLHDWVRASIADSRGEENDAWLPVAMDVSEPGVCP